MESRRLVLNWYNTNFNLKVDKMKLALLCGGLLVPAGLRPRFAYHWGTIF